MKYIMLLCLFVYVIYTYNIEEANKRKYFYTYKSRLKATHDIIKIYLTRLFYNAII